jgi:hypothetical protein
LLGFNITNIVFAIIVVSRWTYPQPHQLLTFPAERTTFPFYGRLDLEPAPFRNIPANKISQSKGFSGGIFLAWQHIFDASHQLITT